MLNDSQKKAWNSLLEFLDSDEQIFSIIGGAGTGKSFLINIINKGIRYIALTSTTNEAANLIGGITINKYLGFGIRNTQEYYDRWDSKDIVVIDEASMLKTHLLSHLAKKGNKIILVGDPNQLTVGININMMDYPYVELKENMRTKNKDLQHLVNCLSKSVDTEIATLIKDHIGDHLELIEDHKEFRRLISSRDKDSSVMAYTNNIVDKYQEHHEVGMSLHKSQGKSYEEVYIDALDLIHNLTKKKNQFNNPLTLDQYLRLISVGVSRAREKVYMFTGNKRSWE